MAEAREEEPGGAMEGARREAAKEAGARVEMAEMAEAEVAAMAEGKEAVVMVVEMWAVAMVVGAAAGATVV